LIPFTEQKAKFNKILITVHSKQVGQFTPGSSDVLITQHNCALELDPRIVTTTGAPGLFCREQLQICCISRTGQEISRSVIGG